MKTKIVAILLVLATLITLLPMTAMAADCTHSVLFNYEYKSNGDYTHRHVCKKCGFVRTESEECSSFTGLACTKCLGPVCNHSLSNHIPNNDGTHTSKCACGKTSTTGDCTFGDDDLCTVCKGANPCDHTPKNPTPNDDCTHTSKCDCGKVTDTGKCTFGADDLCTVCKGENPCDHTPKNPTPNDDATHTSTCDCGKVTDTDDCTFGEDGICTVCKGECAHENTDLVNNGKDHSVSCDVCKLVLSTENHRYDFFSHLCDCGAADPFYQWVCKHPDHHPVNAGTNHKMVCTECHIVCFYEPHGYNAAGVCSCGATAPNCRHEHKTIVNNGANHSTVCDKCGYVFSTEAHTYDVFSMCTCGAVYDNKGPEEPEETAPTYPANAWDHLDDLFTTHK